MKLKPATAELFACASALVDVSSVEAGKPVLLLPMGKFVARGHGEPLVVRDAAHAEQIVAASRATLGRTDMAVDYDHQTVFGAKAGVGGQAKASGWIKPETLTVGPDGISGVIEWTAAAQAAIEAREYRYISPYFGYTPDRAVTRIRNVALTNSPAIEELPAIAASEPSATEGTPMLKEIAKALGLGEDATEAQICARIGELNQERTACASALGLGDQASGEQMIAAAKKVGVPDPAKYAPVTALTEVQSQLKALQTSIAQDKAETTVAAAMAAGKISPAMEGWAKDLAVKHPAAFEAYVAAAAVIVPVGQRPGASGPAPGSSDQLTDEEKQICASMGWDETKFLETKKKDAA